MSARYDEMYPHTTHIEDKMKLLLVMRGYKRHDIHFRGGKTQKRHLRYGYWGSINPKDIEYVEKHTKTNLKEWSIYDEDCGWLFAYDINQGGQNGLNETNKNL